MSAPSVVIDVLLVAGLLVQAVCCAGLVLGAGPLGRLHYAGAASTIGPVLFAAAVLLAQGWSGAGVLTLLTVGFVLISGPVLVAATGRVVHEHERRADEDVEVSG